MTSVLKRLSVVLLTAALTIAMLPMGFAETAYADAEGTYSAEGTMTFHTNGGTLDVGEGAVEDPEVAFSILRDGTVITDSNYLPDDVNDKAHRSMDHLQELFGRERVMTKKPEYDIFIREHGLTSSVGQKNKTK